MSLKAFHIAFVVLSTLLSVGFGVWAVRAYRVTSDVTTLLLGIGSFVFGGLLIIYGVWFLRKLKGVSYL